MADSNQPAEPGLTRVLEEVVSLVEASVEYLVALLRLEGHRLESGARAMAARVIARLVAIIAAVVIVLFGLLFLAFAAAIWMSNLLESTSAGFAIVGAVALTAGAVIAWLATRRGSGIDAGER